LAVLVGDLSAVGCLVVDDNLGMGRKRPEGHEGDQYGLIKTIVSHIYKRFDVLLLEEFETLLASTYDVDALR
jgi:hypothetical protein